MICLCPNHHEQFDDYGYYIDADTLEIKGLDGFEKKKPWKRSNPSVLQF